jgi:N-acetylglucosamine-6-phosphate deacetylase
LADKGAKGDIKSTIWSDVFCQSAMEVIFNQCVTELDIINVRVPDYKNLQRVRVNSEGIVEEILAMDELEAIPSQSNLTSPTNLGGSPDIKVMGQIIDLAGDWISLGGVDLQINGALGLAFPDLNESNGDFIIKICDFLYKQGVDGFLPTLVTTSVENIQRSLHIVSKFSKFMESQTTGAKILGVHLEGPFLNYQKRGAHPPEYLLPLTIENIKTVIGDYASIIKVITLAPELDSTGEVIPYLRNLDITVSLGHSQATAHQAQQAFELGATMVTHAFNAMPPLHHREPGLLGAAITNPHVMCGFIADGQHVNPIMLDILLKASQYDKGLFLVSDALAPLGLSDGVYPWDTREITVTNGTARLADGTLSGTTLGLLVGAKKLLQWRICDLETAIKLTTTAPRKAIGLPTNIIGRPVSQLLRWSWNEVENNLSWLRLGEVSELIQK